MKIALIRGDFAAPAELPNFQPLLKKNEVTLFTGKFPVWNLKDISGFKITKLFSPVDLNFGKISRVEMALLNRIFVDAHVLFGLEDHLKGYDIAHCAETYYSYTQQCIRAKQKGYVKKTVSTVWENIPFNNEGIRGRKEYKSNSFQNIDLFLPVTKAAKEALIKEGCDSQKIEILMPGVDLGLFKKMNVVSFGNVVKNNKIKLLISSRLIPEKGILEIFNIYSRLKAINKNVELIIAGQGQLLEQIENKVKMEKIRDVHVLGKVEYFEMPKLYSICDVLIHYPIGSETWVEQYGMSLIEAMTCGLAVVALDKGSIREVVGEGGIITQQDKFGKHLFNLIRNPFLLERIKIQARKYALSNYDAAKYGKKLERAYSQLLKTKR